MKQRRQDRSTQFVSNISKNNQILVITHLPQIAAKAKHHFKVIKIKESNKYYSTIKKLNKQQRIYEIPSMVSGENISKHSINNAKSLMNLLYLVKIKNL